MDIGGGLGLLLASVLQSAPKLRGTLFEMPYVAEQAQASPILKPFAERCQIQAGNFLESVSPGADAYMMKHIIHDWDDEHSTKILSNCRNAIKPGGKLLVMDQVVEPRNQPGLAKIMDLEMLVNPSASAHRETVERPVRCLRVPSGADHPDACAAMHHRRQPDLEKGKGGIWRVRRG